MTTYQAVTGSCDPAGSVRDHFAALARAATAAAGEAPTVRAWGEELAAVFSRGGRLLACGNGGSAAEAQHLTGELVGRFRSDRPPLSGIALHADTSAVTAIANDYGPDDVFARQVQAHGRRGDVLVAFSTSGTSGNVVAAAKAAQQIGMAVWALTGPGPNPLAAIADSAVTVAAETVATVQEVHLAVVHALCAVLDETLGYPG